MEIRFDFYLLPEVPQVISCEQLIVHNPFELMLHAGELSCDKLSARMIKARRNDPISLQIGMLKLPLKGATALVHKADWLSKVHREEEYSVSYFVLERGESARFVIGEENGTVLFLRKELCIAGLNVWITPCLLNPYSSPSFVWGVSK